MSLRRWMALLVLAGMAFVGASLVISALQSHPRARAVTQPGPLVIVAMPRLTWSDVSRDRTPNMWRLAERGAVGAQATRSPAGRNCSVQSWLILAAGTPTDTGPGRCVRVAPSINADGSAAFADWSEWRSTGLQQSKPADLGGVASSLAKTGTCIAAVGPRAALGAADRSGTVAVYSDSVESIDLAACSVTLIDLKHLNDAALGSLIDQLPADVTIVVTGMAADGRTPTLQPVIMAGPGVLHGVLTSLSTRQPGVLQTADLSALVLARLGSNAPIIGQGRPPMVRPVTGADTAIDRVVGLARGLDLEHPFVPWFFTLFLGGSAIAVILGLIWRRANRRACLARGEEPTMSVAARAWLASVAAMCAAMPAAVLLSGWIPWWNAGQPQLALSLSIIGISAVLSVIALLGPWRGYPAGPFMFMATATFFVVAEDVVHGSGLQFIALMGLQPVYGGRYYGQGNVGYAVFATTAILIATVVAGRMIQRGQRRAAVVAVVFIGLFALVLDGSPSWGADGGGPLAMAPAFGYLALKAGRERVTVRRVITTLAVTVGLVGVFALFDYLGPEAYRTHLGDFVAQVVSHERWAGLTTIWTENWRMLTNSWLPALVPFLLGGTIYLARRPELYAGPLEPITARVPFLKHGLSAILICWVLAFISNDSGVGIPPTGLVVLAPLLLLLGVSRKVARTEAGATEDVAGLTEPAPVGSVS